MKAIEVLKEYTVYLKENFQKKDLTEHNPKLEHKNTRVEVH